MSQVEIWLNPLDLFDPDEGPSATDDILGFMCTPGVPSDTASIQLRYREISAEQPRLFALPRHNRILDHLVWPLRHAKASYMVGNYLGTMALAGVVAEMTAILLFELVEAGVNKQPLTTRDQERLFGRPFEKLGQERRIDVLKVFGVLSPEAAEAYERIRKVRNLHLHLVQLVDVAAFARDARAVFRDTVTVVAEAIGQGVQEGKLVFRPEMMRYLERAGMVRRPDDSTSDQPSATGDPTQSSGTDVDRALRGLDR